MRFQMNNKGMTLIELIISMAISGILLSIIVMIISSASFSFRRTNDEVNLQLEAQATLNQLSNLAMEASEIREASLKPSPADVKYIIEGNPNDYEVLYRKDDMKIYLREVTPIDPNPVDTVPFWEEANFEAEYLMAEYVKDFVISGLNTNKVTIDISFELGSDTYSVNKKVKLRNAN